MIRPSALKSLLTQTNSGGVKSALLLDREGTLVSSAGLDDTQSRVTSGVVATIWASYGLSAKGAIKDVEKKSFPVESLIISCESGLVAIVGIQQTEFMVCLFSDDTCEIGMLKKKAKALAVALQGPLTLME